MSDATLIRSLGHRSCINVALSVIMHRFNIVYFAVTSYFV